MKSALCQHHHIVRCDENYSEVMEWVRENCGRYHISLDVEACYKSEKSITVLSLSFEKEIDAVACRLRW